MKPRLRRLHSPDAPDLDSFAPESPSFSILLQLLVGPWDGPGEESFDVLLCSTAWIAQQAGPLVGRHLLIVREYDFLAIRQFIEAYLDTCEAPNWQGVAERVGRLGRWEFEDYAPRG